jgi:hypothetical protein
VTAAVDTAVDRLIRQAELCTAMGSPLGGAVLSSLAGDARRDGPVAGFIESMPARAQYSRIGVRFLGAIHSCALDGSAPRVAAHYPTCGGDGDPRAASEAALDVIATQSEKIGALFERTPQTNEVARSMLLLAGALTIARQTGLPLRIFDVGASAGLNARLDRYRYEGRDWSWGDPASPLVLRNRETSGRPRYTDAPLDIVERCGVDLNPRDIASEDDRRELRSFVWPDQVDRIERLEAAFAAAAATPVPIDRADFLRWLPERVSPQPQSVSVVMHSVVTEHLPAEVKAQLLERIVAIGTRATTSAPVAWLRLEIVDDRCYETRVTLWPSGEEFPIALCDGHAQDIVWNDAR